MKSIWTSKTVWLFIILAIGAISNSIFGLGLPLIENAEWVVLSISLVAFFLRLLTGEPISWDTGTPGKKFYQSKTFWVAVILILASTAVKFGWLNLEVTPNAPWVAIALSIIAFILRLFTKESIEFEKKR